MRIHKQRFRHDPDNGFHGDCHRTCIAMLLDLEPEDVPNFSEQAGEDAEKFHQLFSDWLLERGWATVSIAYACTFETMMYTLGATNKNNYYILGGTSANGTGHSVIGLGGEIFADPSLDDSGIIGPMSDGYFWVTFLIPSGLTNKATSVRETLAQTFQERVKPWMDVCFGPEISSDRLERGDRFLEEALELLQSGEYPKERVAALVDYVFGREKGEPAQEVGGVMVTLAAYCLAHELNMHGAGETELNRVWTKVEQIRAKQATKNFNSPIPTPTTTSPAHPDDIAVDRFAAAMKEKLALKRSQGRGGWDDPGAITIGKLSRLLCDHVAKGDPVDVGNLAMMIHQRGGRILGDRERYVDAVMEARALDDDALEARKRGLARGTFTVPEGYIAVRDAAGWATGELVKKSPS